MKNDYFVKKCERCGAEIKVPREYPGNDFPLKWYQVNCPNFCKTHTYDYDLNRWLK